LAKSDAGQKYTAPGRPRVEAQDWLGSGAVMKGTWDQIPGRFLGVISLVDAEGAAVERWESVRRRKEMLGNDNVECDIFAQFEDLRWKRFTGKSGNGMLVWMNVGDIDKGWRGVRGVRRTKRRCPVLILCRNNETEQ